ncbi:MAG: DHH family phosphoesterase [Lewinellaceae bacterium]|nr:DHH family phosphoesterase [Phaeodactylibacter sp.]MCB0612209.1 DHH family phosphoesterase [Phaeodactylibacter sp.]MCB9349349.1 DHH family phosphoesterase [Lewinellaceae bacterium]
MENIKELKALLAYPKDIVITTHRNPDGDAIGSSLGVYHFLNKLGHAVRIVSPSEYPDVFGWMKDIEKIIIYDTEPEEAQAVIQRADMIFCLDFNALDRIDKVGELIEKARGVKVMVDHHLYPEPFPEFMLSDTTASSTCELVFDLITGLGWKEHMDHLIGECLFTGILTDTGSFKYSTSAKLFRIVAELIEFGVDDYRLQDRIFNSMKEKHLRLLGHCLNNRMEILEEYQTGIITLTKEDYVDFDIQRGDTEGIVNFLLKVKKVKVAAFITEQPTIVKISLRSKGDFSVQEIARQHFKGGGHKNASGGYSFQSLSATVRRFKGVLPQYKDQLMASEQ